MTAAARSRDLFRSPAAQLALSGVRAAIAGPGCVLICGEPGTGRAAFAEAIHRATHGDSTSLEELLYCGKGTVDSPAPFVVAGCTASRDVEALLFGRCASSNTHDSLESVSTDCLLYRARHGTLFLSTVHDIPGRIQNRLARVLRDGEVWLDDGAVIPGRRHRRPGDCVG